VTLVFVPEAAALNETEWREVESIVGRALSARPASVRRQISVFFRALDLLAFVRHGRSLAALPIDHRTRMLEGLSKSRLLLLRRGVWALRTLSFMGYYARPAAARAIGYGASAVGWSAARAGRVR
jgi:hypothetical protein